jgi:putative SOS response-associated peptidase YedK
MCGRYVTVTRIEAIEKRFKVTAVAPEAYSPNVNISHGEMAPVITCQNPEELQFFQFGFTPEWADKQYYMVNARAEGDHNKENDPKYTGPMGIIKKPMFRKAIRSQRCLVVADAFIEGPKKERLNKPYVMYMRDGQHPFAFAGIWDRWVNTSTGEVISSFAIITTMPNALTQKIGHHRSPVILHKEDEHAWLDPDLPLQEATDMLRPYPASEMNAYPIDVAIKAPKANGLDLLAPIGQRVYKEYDYVIYDELQLEGMGSTTARKRKLDEEPPSLFDDLPDEA